MKRHQLIFLSLFLIIISCKKDDEGTIDADHQINITSPEANQTLWNEIKITTDITFNQSPSKVEFYLGEELLETVASEPYEATFNSQNYDDGDYKIKVVSYDDLDEQVASEEVDFKIYNTLIALNIYKNITSDRQYIIITDNNGKLIDYLKIDTSEEVINIHRPVNFNDSTFALHTLTYYSYGAEEGGDFVYLISDYEITPGSFVVGTNKDPTPPLQGEAYFNFTDIPTHTEYRIIANHRTSYGTSLSPSSSIFLNDDISKVDIFLNTENGPAFKTLENIKPNESYTISLNDLNYNVSNYEFPLKIGELELSTYNLIALTENSSPTYKILTQYSRANSFVNNFEFSLPEPNTFGKFETLIQMRKPKTGIEYINRSRGLEPNINFKIIDAQINVLGTSRQNISFSTSGNYDYLYTNWTSFLSLEPEDTEYNNYVWSTISKNKEAIYFPEIPIDIITKYSRTSKDAFLNGESLSLNVQLVDYESCTSYEDFINNRYQRNSINIYTDFKFLSAISMVANDL